MRDKIRHQMEGGEEEDKEVLALARKCLLLLQHKLQYTLFQGHTGWECQKDLTGFILHFFCPDFKILPANEESMAGPILIHTKSNFTEKLLIQSSPGDRIAPISAIVAVKR